MTKKTQNIIIKTKEGWHTYTAMYKMLNKNIILPVPSPVPKVYSHSFIQDGRVEGRALIFSCENSKIATNSPLNNH